VLCEEIGSISWFHHQRDPTQHPSNAPEHQMVAAWKSDTLCQPVRSGNTYNKCRELKSGMPRSASKIACWSQFSKPQLRSGCSADTHRSTRKM